MHVPATFEGPRLTLFLLERHRVRMINGHGEEVLLPLADFHRFLLHLARCTPSLHLPVSVSRWLAFHLTHSDQHA